MPELSTLLRLRLGAAQKTNLQHPDPDVLTAFSEELLPPAEREYVLKHVALCGECREVLALTAPEVDAAAQPEVETVAAAPVRRRRWFLTPAFGLAGSIAAMILGVALILELPQRTEHFSGGTTLRPVPNQTAQLQAPAPQAKAENQPASVPASGADQVLPPPPPLPNAVRASRAVADEKAITRAKTPPVVVADLRKQDYVNKTLLNSFAYETQAAAPVYRDLPQAPSPAQRLAFAPPSVVAGSSLQNQNFDLNANAPAGQNQGVVTISPETPDKNTVLGKIVDFGKRPLGRRSGPAIPSNSLNDRAMFKPGATVAQPGEAIPAKGNQSDGTLAASPAFTGGALLSRRAMLGATPYQWKVVDGKLLKSSDLSHWSEENPAGENVQFSVVSANGPEIWAGGHDAALMHSHDGGTSWERVTLGSTATGTINSIEAAGLNLHIRSSSGQSWASQDGGKSWSLQD